MASSSSAMVEKEAPVVATLTPAALRPTSNIDEASINEELKRILRSQALRRAPTLRHLLQYAVSEALSSGRVNERLIARNVLGAEDGFDPALDPIVRVQCGRLRRRLHVYYENEGLHDPLRIAIPERSYTPVFERPVSAIRNEPSEQEKNKKPAIAVLPFLNLTNAETNDLVCASLTDELISALAAVPEVDVVARSSAFQFKGERIDVRVVGQELGVDLILEGSLKTDSDVYRVTAQMATVKDGFALWAESYEYANGGNDSTLPLKTVVDDIVHALPLPPAEPDSASR